MGGILKKGGGGGEIRIVENVETQGMFTVASAEKSGISYGLCQFIVIYTRV